MISPVSYEELPWSIDPDARAFIPKSRRRKITATYKAAIPASISTAAIDVPEPLLQDIASIMADLVRFDAKQTARGYSLPALLLRSESAASSQIEHLTSSVRNVAMAEVSPDAPRNAKLIAGNVAAMRKALDLSENISTATLCAIHRALLEGHDSFAGKLRNEQVWVGGTPYSPHGALFVPPQASRVPDCLDDLASFVRRDDVNPVVKAAIAHAQFETIHPFIDGNGRTGRTLLHIILKREGLLENSMLPVSAGLLNHVDAYMDSIRAYQAGDASPLVENVLEALEVALSVGEALAASIDALMDRWNRQITERANAAIHRLPSILAEQPVVSIDYLASHLSITPRAAQNLAARACEYGFLRPIGNRHRGILYQANEVIDLLEEASDVEGIRRMLSSR